MINFWRRQRTYWLGLARRLFQFKFWILIGIIWIVEAEITGSIVRFSRTTGEKTIPAIYVFIQSNPMFYGIFLLMVICLFSEVPFSGREQMYVMLREGKKRWYIRQICYLCFGAAAAIIAAIVICQVQLVSCLKMSGEWDRILGTLAFTDAGHQMQVFLGVPPRILANYTPLEAFSQAVMIGWGVILFLGVFMFVVSLCFTRKMAVIAATAMAVMCCLHKYYPPWMNYASPVSWIRTVDLGMKYMDHAPGLSYVGIALPCVIIICIGAGWIAIQKMDLNWTEE